MQKNILKVIAAMLALSLVLVACSDKKDDEKTESKKDDTTMTKDTLNNKLSIDENIQKWISLWLVGYKININMKIVI